MRVALLIARREASSYFRSPIGAVVLSGALLVIGILFYWKGLTEKLLSSEVLSEFFYSSSGVVMVASLFLSMRLVAEERQTGTLTLLNTAPVTAAQIVAGKFLAAFGMVATLTALTVYMPLLIFVNGKVSLGHIAVGYGGLLLIGAACVAIGLFASALTESQVVAVVVSGGIIAALILQWILAKAVDPPFDSFLVNLAFHHTNFRPFQQGILELQGVAYYLAVAFLFLLGATKVLEARRWK